MENTAKRGRPALAAVVIVAMVLGAIAALMVAAGSSASAASNSTLVAKAKANVAAGFKGVFGKQPTSGPKPTPGKKIWILNCSSQAPGCADTAGPAAEAAKKLGWDVTVQDGKFTPAVYNQIIRQATAAGDVDGLFLIGVTCADAPASIKAAIDAGIKVVMEGGANCATPLKGLYIPEGHAGKTNLDFQTGAIPRLRADYVIAKSNGKAHVLMVRLGDNSLAEAYVPAFLSRMKQCKGCVVHNLKVTTPDYAGGKVQAKVGTALVKYRDVDTIVTVFDGLYNAGTGAAAKASGRKFLTIGFDGQPQIFAGIRAGTIAASTFIPVGYSGWGGIDVMNRLFAGQRPASTGNGYQLVDKTHNLPRVGVKLSTDGPLTIPWKKNYLKIWGVS